MKVTLVICLSSLLVSCFDNRSEKIDQLEQRMTQLEQELDSSKGNKSKNASYSEPIVDGNRCCATTKRGSQCRRKPKKNSAYCWQHGG